LLTGCGSEKNNEIVFLPASSEDETGLNMKKEHVEMKIKF
jgi:hypothetical protein